MASPARRRVNLTIPVDKLEQAKNQGLNLSRVLEEAIDRRLKEEKARRWQEDNREAIAAYNAYIEKFGCFGDRHRSF